MKQINLINQLRSLVNKPSFTIEDAAKKGVSRRMLGYYTSKGILHRVSPGIYRFADQELKVDFRWEDLVRSIHQIPSGIICLITALAIYDLTDEIAREFWIAIPHEQHIIAPDKVKVVRMRNTTLGKSTYKLGKYKAAIFDKERTVIDAFRYLDKEIAIRALKRLAVQGLNHKKIDLYAKKLRTNITPYLLAVTT